MQREPVQVIADESGRMVRLGKTMVAELYRMQVFTVAAALAFYFLLAFVPLLFVLGMLLSYLPIPNLFGQLLVLMSTLVPRNAMNLVLNVMQTMMNTNHGKLIWVGLIGSLWAASGGFSAAIDALNVAYDAEKSRSWVRDRLVALGLTMTVGAMCVAALFAIVLGPHFGESMENAFQVSNVFTHLWRVLRVVGIFAAGVVSIMMLYFFAPNVKQRMRSTVPGACFAVAVFFLGSFGLSVYVQRLSNYAHTYGALGAVLALMLWLYVMSIAIFVGAELNAELLRESGVLLEGQRSWSHMPSLKASEMAADGEGVNRGVGVAGGVGAAVEAGRNAAKDAVVRKA
jgi:membrane protein